MTATATRPLVTGNGDPEAPAALPSSRIFIAPSGETMDYARGPDIERIADALIATCPELAFLQNVILRYLWRRKKQTSQGLMVLGTCKPLSGIPQFALGGGEFLVVLNAEGCRDAQLRAWQLEALIFHELCHIAPADPDEPGSQPTGIGHDFEGFTAELERYGMWLPTLERAGAAFAQLTLWGED